MQTDTQTDSQTDRQADRNTPHPYWDGVTRQSINTDGTFITTYVNVEGQTVSTKLKVMRIKTHSKLDSLP